VHEALQLYLALGRGLFESVYERLLAVALEHRGLRVSRQHAVDYTWGGEHFTAGFRVDLLVEDALVVELRAVETLGSIPFRQVLTYLRLMNLPLGLVVNFGGERFKTNLQRVVNHRALEQRPGRTDADGFAAMEPTNKEAGPRGEPKRRTERRNGAGLSPSQPRLHREGDV
jgi:iron complex transport system substrate-binding protein